MTDRSREAGVVVACARVSPHPHALARALDPARGPLDWDAVLHLAMRHSLVPLMHRHLGACEAVPKSASALLWAHAQMVARRNRARIDELLEIAAALAHEGVRFAPFKGPVLGAQLYGDAMLREFGDLDMLVAPGDMRRAIETLEKRGYASVTPMDARRKSLWLDSPGLHELPMADIGRGFVVELQWRANPDVDVPALGDDAWWERAPWLELEGFRMRTLPPDEHMLALLVHGAKHSWASMDLLVDVAELARSGCVPWDALLRLARSHGAARRAALGLGLARTLLDAPLPQPVVDFVREWATPEVERRIVASHLAPEYVRPSVVQLLRHDLALLDSTPRRIARIASWMRPTPGDWTAHRFPASLTFLYWVVRPLRLAWKYLFRVPSR